MITFASRNIVMPWSDDIAVDLVRLTVRKKQSKTFSVVVWVARYKKAGHGWNGGGGFCYVGWGMTRA